MQAFLPVYVLFSFKYMTVMQILSFFEVKCAAVATHLHGGVGVNRNAE